MASAYTADPRDEELQLLRQLLSATGPIQIRHSSTLAIIDRLEARGEACLWADFLHQLWADITVAGRRALR